MGQGKGASQGCKASHGTAVTTPGDDFARGRSKKMLGCICTMKLETTTLASYPCYAEANCYRFFFLLILHDISAMTVHPARITVSFQIMLFQAENAGSAKAAVPNRSASAFTADIGMLGWEELPDQGRGRIIILSSLLIPRKWSSLWKSLVVLHAGKVLVICIFFNK